MPCWHRWPKKWTDWQCWRDSGAVCDQIKRCEKCNKTKTRKVQ